MFSTSPVTIKRYKVAGIGIHTDLLRLLAEVIDQHADFGFRLNNIRENQYKVLLIYVFAGTDHASAVSIL